MKAVKMFHFAILLAAIAHLGSAQIRIQVNSCGLLSPPMNGMISRCTRGNRVGSVCTMQCLVGFVPATARRKCVCLAGFCVWKGINPTCQKIECPRPDLENGKLTIVDKWPKGFAGLVEFGNIGSEFRDGWSVIIAFNKPLGQRARLSSWSAEPAGVSTARDAFTLNNAPFNRYPDLNSTGNTIRALFIVDELDDDIPNQGYVGLYNHRLVDATCFPSTTYKDLDLISSFAASSVQSTTTPRATSGRMSRPQITTNVVETNSALLTTIASTASPETTASVTEIDQRATTMEVISPNVTESQIGPMQIVISLNGGNTSVTTPVPITVPGSTTAARQKEYDVGDGRKCKLQGDRSYRTQPGWVDGEKPYFSGNAIAQIESTMDDWVVVVVFQRPVVDIKIWNVMEDGKAENGHIWRFGANIWNRQLHKGEININFIAQIKRQLEVNPDGRVYLCSTEIDANDSVLLFEDSVLDPAAKEVESFTYEVDENGDLVTEAVTLAPGETHAPTTRPYFGPTTQVSTEERCRPNAPSGRLPIVRGRQTKPRWKRSRDKTPYDYNEVLHKSILFYDAQRAGALPPRYNRIPWRGDSTLKDGCPIGVDLSGGWFDAGDHVKFTYPMAFSVTVLSWGGILFRRGYTDAGVITRLLGTIKWPVNWLMKAHTAPFELVAMVGNGHEDHRYWGRPEEMTMDRPVYKVTKTAPGTEVAAETAAALAAASIFLKKTHKSVATEALRHAKELYEFATQYKGNYQEAVPEVHDFYRSFNGYNDELVWSAAWMYKATGIARYLVDARREYANMRGQYSTSHAFSWDDKLVGAQVLLASITGESIFKSGIERFLNKMMNKVAKTPQGVMWLDQWSPNRYAANAAFIAMAAAEIDPPLPDKERYIAFARKQLHLLLGDSGMSYVIGIGKKYARRAHHRASACRPPPAPCNVNTFFSSRLNFFTLYGALVGGPDKRGVYDDNRADHKQSEVACDYNAGFQSAIAGLKELAVRNRTRVRTDRRG